MRELIITKDNGTMQYNGYQNITFYFIYPTLLPKAAYKWEGTLESITYVYKRT